MKILLIDDHAVVRAGLAQLLRAEFSATVSEAPDAASALVLAGEGGFDLAILDLGLPDAGGFGLLPQLLENKMKVLVLSMHTEVIYARRALQGGAAGYISKNTPVDELLEAIRTALRGDRYVERTMARELAVVKIEQGRNFDRLSARDLDIMRLLGEGNSLAMTAEILGVSYKTVANTTGFIKAKLGVARTADLIRIAIESRSRAPTMAPIDAHDGSQPPSI